MCRSHLETMGFEIFCLDAGPHTLLGFIQRRHCQSPSWRGGSIPGSQITSFWLWFRKRPAGSRAKLPRSRETGSIHSGKPESPTGQGGNAGGKDGKKPNPPKSADFKRFHKSSAHGWRGAESTDHRERTVAGAFQGLFCSPELQHSSYF